MPTLEQRIAFSEKHLTNKEGRSFSLEGRPWVAEEFFSPADGFKLWPADNDQLCDDCRGKSGQIVEWALANETQTPEHRAIGCAGLDYQPVIMTVLNLPRREGKTFNTAAYCISALCLGKNKSITYVASAEGQTAQLFEENFVRPVLSSPALSSALRVVGGKLQARGTKSFLECVATSHGSITGRGRTHVIVDEARDVSARVAMALIPSVFASNGVECPAGHVHAPRGPDAPDTCSVCGAGLVPWYGRIILMSSSGLIEGGDKDWFGDLVEQLESRPDPNCHLFRASESSNPDVDVRTKDMVERVFGQIDSTRTYVDIEVHNVARRKGDDFVTQAELENVVDRTLLNREGSVRRCVAFLDTSITSDTTSLVIVGEDTDLPASEPWERLVTERIDIWEPKKLKGGVIDPEQIQAHLDLFMPMFPALVAFYVDVRLMPWASKLVQVSKTGSRVARPWGRKVEGFRGGQPERDAAWNILEQRILSRTIKIPNLPALLKEIRAVRKLTRLDGSTEVRDRSRKKRHADIAESLAACCYLAHLESLKSRASFHQAGRTSDVLTRLYRPMVQRMNINSF